MKKSRFPDKLAAMAPLAFLRYPTWLRPEIVPGLPLRWYGMMYLVAFAVAYVLVKVQVKERKLEVGRDEVLNLFFWGIVGLLVGARLFAVTIYDPSGYYLRHPLQIILPFSLSGGRVRLTGLAGMSYHGGLLGTVVACIIYLKVRKLDILSWGDMLVTGASLGYTFGRLGNFINGELWGRITTLPWGMIFPQAPQFSTDEPWVRAFAERAGLSVAGQQTVNLPRHPSQLYEAFCEGVLLWAILWLIFRPRRAFRGQQLSVYIIGYGVFRFLIEYVRQPDSYMGYPIQLVKLDNPGQFSPFNFTTGQILSSLMFVGGVVCLLVFSRVAARRRQQQETPRPSGRKLRKKLR